MLSSNDREEILVQTRRLRRRFADTADEAWDAVTAGSELAVQLGHLALCLLRSRGADTTALEDAQRPIEHVGDELADVVLSGASIALLADGQPVTSAPDRRAPTDEVEEFFRLVVAAGALVEAAMVTTGYRHRPSGDPPSVARASGVLLADCARMADSLGLDLMSEFTGMVADADSFLDTVFSDAADREETRGCSGGGSS